MDAFFILLRLPFFLIGFLFLVALPIVLCALVVGFAPCVLPLAIVVWLVLLAVASIVAAFENRSDTLTAFFKGTREFINALWEPFAESIKHYPESFVFLFEWLIGKKKRDSQ